MRRFKRILTHFNAKKAVCQFPRSVTSSYMLVRLCGSQISLCRSSTEALQLKCDTLTFNISITKIIGIFITAKFLPPGLHKPTMEEEFDDERPPSYLEHVQAAVEEIVETCLNNVADVALSNNVRCNCCPLFVHWHRITYLVFHCQVVSGQRDAATSVLPHNDDDFRYLVAALCCAGSLFSLCRLVIKHTVYGDQFVRFYRANFL